MGRAGSTRLQTRSGSVGRASAIGRGGRSLCATNDSKRSDSGRCTIRQSRGVQNKGADFATTGSVSGDESGSPSIGSGDDGSTRSTREDDTGAILIGGSNNVSSAGATSAAAWRGCVGRADNISILINSNAGNR